LREGKALGIEEATVYDAEFVTSMGEIYPGLYCG
jgi:hypothetical protein